MSVGLLMFSWVLYDEERLKKGLKENGVIYGEVNGVVRVGEYFDLYNVIIVKSYEFMNGLCENGSERGFRVDLDDLNVECNGVWSSFGGDL